MEAAAPVYRGRVGPARLVGLVRRLGVRHRQQVTDAGIAAAVTVLVQVGVWQGTEWDELFADPALSSVILLIATVALFWRRSHPLVVACIAAAAVLLQAVLTGVFAQSPALALAVAVVLYSLGAHATPRFAVLGGLLLAGSLHLKAVLVPPAVADESPFVALFWWLAVVTLVGVGWLMRALRHSAAVQREAMLLEQRRSEEAAEAARQERQRIARELHDVVSHNLSATILQAGAARALVHSDPESAARLLDSIQELGREAMTEMRRMLGIMRQAGEAPGSAPQPRLSDLPALVARAGELGTEVVLHVDSELPPLAAGVELSAYRIVQEALTNVRKHSDAQHVVVNLRHSEPWLEIEVIDDGRPLTGTNGQPGHGLIGMRERVALLGGELAAGTSGSEAGFRVHARLPERGVGR